MKNNTVSNRLGKLVIRERFETITNIRLDARALYDTMTSGWADTPKEFKEALREAFRPVELTCDMRKNSTWEALASAIAAYEALSIVEATPDLRKSARGTNHSLSTVSVSEEQKEAPRGTNNLSPAVDESPLEKWHLDDPDWRDAKVMLMGEWHPHFRKIESQLKRRLYPFSSVVKEYATLLLSETTDDADDLLRHLHEEVVTYLANKLGEAVNDAWRETTAVTLRPNSPVKRFEELIEECRQMIDSPAVSV